MKAVQPPSGRTIILELVREMEARLYPLLYRVLPPGVYHVYLHPDDYREIEAIAPVIAADAQRGLSERVDELNRRTRWQVLLQGKQPPIEVPPGGWEISIQPDANGELGRGELGIVSRLSLPAAPRFEGGTPTTRIARTVVTGSLRRTTTTEQTPAPLSDTSEMPRPAAAMPAPAPGTGAAAQPIPAAAPPPVAAAPAAHGSASPIQIGSALETPPLPAMSAAGPSVATAPGESTSTTERRGETGRAFARLAYVDEQGPHVFIMRKDVVSIGRGGSAHWVDVQVATGARVSREHCRIRRTQDGRFFLQDLSTWGTTVDGRRVEPFVRTAPTGQLEETGKEHELPEAARIQLADALLIEFQAIQTR